MARWRWAFIIAGAAVITAAWWWRTSSPTPAPDPVPEPLRLPPPAPQQAVPSQPVEVVPQISGAEAAVQIAGPNGVVCRLEPAASGGSAQLVPSDLGDSWLAVALVGAGYLVLSDVPPEGEGTLRVEGFAPVTVTWSDHLEGPVGHGGCAPDPVRLEPASAAIVGVVSGAAGRAAQVTVEGCGQRAVVDDDGSYYLGVGAGERCTVIASRHLGVLAYSTPPVDVVARSGHDVVVDLAVPDIEAVAPVVVDDDLRITAVWSELPLEPGDQVVAIDGAAVPVGQAAFVEASGGPAGEVVELEVEGPDGQRRVVEVELQVLGFDDWLVNGG